MQKIKKILKITGGVSEWIDERGNPANPPTVPIGANLALEIDVREALNDGLTDALPAYPIAELSADSYSFAIDGDYDHLTDPKMLKLSGVTIAEGTALPDGSKRTIITATIPNTNYAGLKVALETSETIEMEGELAGHDADSVSVFVFAFPVIVRNRVWFPDDAPESVTEDPDYLNSAQVEAKIAAEVAAAVAAATAELDGADGTSNFIYVAYASDNAGADFNFTPSASLPFMAIITSATELDPPVEANFSAATWVQFIGNDGTTTTNVTGLNLSPQGDWAVGTTYAENDAARHNGAIWQSLSDSNTGNEPSAESEYWQLILQDGEDGQDAQAVLLAYNTVSTADDPGWHTTLAADDVYFRISLDGGVTWTIAKQLTQSHSVIAQYNPDAMTDWATASKPAGAIYSTATGAYFRIAFTGGVYGNSQAIKAGMASQVMRVQFSATGDDETPTDWHAEPVEGDTYVRFYNDSGSIRMKYTIDAGGLDIVSVQLSPIDNPWHTTFASATDKYMRISTDSGSNFSAAIKVVGTDASEPQAEFSANGVDWSNSPTNAVYQRWSTDGGVTWTAAIQIKGEAGAGIEIGAIGLLADRGDYDAAAVGFIYLATDVEEDDDGRPYNLLYMRSSSTQGAWSDGAIAYIGPQGATGPASTVPGLRGADATIIPDLEFASTDLVEDIEHGGALTIPGVKAIAQVEVYDTNGDGISIERGDAAENGACMIKTKYTANETIVYFGTIDVTNGGRIKFAQGTEANSILLGSNTDFFMDVLKLRLRRPYITSNLHLVVQGSVAADFAGYATIIDTENAAADRAIVEGYDPVAEKFVVCPETGFSADFVGQSILVGMAGLGSPRYIRYKWTYTEGDTGWYTTFFPSSGESFASEIPVDTTGALLKVSTVNAVGEWSLDGGTTWYASGSSQSLAAGSYTVTFSDESGYLTPGNLSITLVAGDSKSVYGNYLDAAGGAGTLTVNISGPAAARWSIDGINWYATGVTLDVLAGDYVVQFLAVDLYLTPAAQPNTVADTDDDVLTATYYAEESPAAYGMSWVNGDDPTGQNVIRYCTPAGAGNKDGSDWANACAGLYRAVTLAGAFDFIFMWEGEYPILAPITIAIPRIYGGFNGDGTWATRDGFAHQTIIKGSSFKFTDNANTTTADGIVLSGFNTQINGTSSVSYYTNCAFIDCNAGTGTLLPQCNLISNCLFSNCTAAAIFTASLSLSLVMVDCVFVDTSGGISLSENGGCAFFRGTISFAGILMTDCEFTGVVIESGTGTAYTGCTMSNCEIANVEATATACKFINCKIIGGGVLFVYALCTTAVNCLFENCTAITTLVRYSATYCTAIRCNKPIAPTVKNCAAWRTSAVGTNRTTCAQSVYIDEATVVLGDDNTLAEFTSLGNITAEGAITPSPEAGDWGDYSIGATSVLKGTGTLDETITTDITGAVRSNPPSIGCYE